MNDGGRESDAELGVRGASLAERREFLKKAGEIAVTAPAAALLLSIAAKRANADAITASVADVIGTLK